MRCASARSGLNRGRLRPCRPCASIWNAYGGTRMSPADFDRCEDAWCRMLDERNRMFDRYLTGMRCARYVLFGVWILAFAIVGLILVEVSS